MFPSSMLMSDNTNSSSYGYSVTNTSSVNQQDLFQNDLEEKVVDTCPISITQPLLNLPNYQYRSYPIDNTSTVTLPIRYEPIINQSTSFVHILGTGGYGVVILAKDLNRNGQLVAIKKVGNIFEKLPYRMLREIKILKHLQGHQNIINFIEFYLPGNCLKEMNDLYIVFEYMNGGDLHGLMNGFSKQKEGISIQLIKDIMCQLLSALYFLESVGILHRDIKPSNLLINNTNNNEIQLKLCDFGLSNQEVPIVTNPESFDVVTSLYKSPEIILQYEVQSSSMDAWACGCILAELLYLLPPYPSRRPLFIDPSKYLEHGFTTIDHLNTIVSILGKPNEEDIKGSPQAIKKFLELFKNYSTSGYDFSQIFGNAPSDAIDLLKRFFIWNPHKRINFEEALKHPFLADNKYSYLVTHNIKLELENIIVTKRNDISLLKYLFYKEIVDWNN